MKTLRLTKKSRTVKQYGWNYGPTYEQDFEITPEWRPEPHR